MDALLGNGPRPADVRIEPDWAIATPMLLGWVATIAYVVVFSSVAPPPLATGDNVEMPWRQLRDQQMQLYQNASVIACTDPFDHACGRYAEVEPVGPFQRAALIMSERVRQLPVVRECEAVVEFDNQSIEPADTLLETLITGVTVDGWAARTAPHEGLFSLHVFHENATSFDTHMLNPTCLNNWVYNQTTSFDIVFYPTAGINATADIQACQLAARWSGARGKIEMLSGAADYPSDCLQYVRQLQPAKLAKALRPGNITMARLHTLATRLQAAANITTPVEFVGGEGGLPDIAVALNVSVAWAEHNRRMGLLLGSRVANAVWSAAADEVNAYYDPCQKRVFVPAGILTPPFYSDQYDDELVLGGIGFVIAHELGHAVDHECNKSELRATIARHMASVMHMPLMAVNHTVSEDIADELGGQYVQELGGASTRFGLQLIQLWCGNSRNFTADPHAPGVARVNTLFTGIGALSGIFC